MACRQHSLAGDRGGNQRGHRMFKKADMLTRPTPGRGLTVLLPSSAEGNSPKSETRLSTARPQGARTTLEDFKSLLDVRVEGVACAVEYLCRGPRQLRVVCVVERVDAELDEASWEQVEELFQGFAQNTLRPGIVDV